MKNLATDIVETWTPGPLPNDPMACWLPSRNADRSVWGPDTLRFPCPDRGYLITEKVLGGRSEIEFRTPRPADAVNRGRGPRPGWLLPQLNLRSFTSNAATKVATPQND